MLHSFLCSPSLPWKTHPQSPVWFRQQWRLSLFSWYPPSASDLHIEDTVSSNKINCSDTWQSPRIIPSALAASCTSATSSLLCPMTKPVDKSWRSMVSEDEEAATEMERPSLRSTEPKADLSWDLYNTLPVLSKIVSQLFIHLRVGECKNRGSEWELRLGPSIGSNVRSGLRSSVHFWTGEHFNHSWPFSQR